MEYKPATDLFEFIEQHSLDEKTVKVIFKQVLLAIEHIHDLGIVHRDIKVRGIYKG
jgi:serine/threonine protein kinase